MPGPVAQLIESSQPRINNLLNGASTISPGDLLLLADQLGFTDEGYKDTLRELRRDNHKRGWSKFLDDLEKSIAV